METKVVVVTGGTKGIGRAIVERFAGEGFWVFTCSRKPENVEALIEHIQRIYPNAQISAIAADLSIKAEVQRFVEFVKSKTPKVDVLVNNTGVFMPGQVHNEAEGILEAQIETNLYSAYHLTRGVLDVMLPFHKGHIFMMCSTASITPYVNGGSYCISKYALYGMSKVLREEMKTKGIRVTAILPGATLTDSWAGVDLPPERFMKPEDVAAGIWGAYQMSEQTVVEELLIRPQLGDIG